MGSEKEPLGKQIDALLGEDEAKAVLQDLASAIAKHDLVRSPETCELLFRYMIFVTQGWNSAQSKHDPQSGRAHHFHFGGLLISIVYRARMTTAILSITGIANVTGLTLNGADADVQLTETGATQQIPALGTVVLTSGN